jgi:hypothetical protein
LKFKISRKKQDTEYGDTLKHPLKAPINSFLQHPMMPRFGSTKIRAQILLQNKSKYLIYVKALTLEMPGLLLLPKIAITFPLR